MHLDPIPLSEFAARRRRLSADLDGAVGLVFAGDGPGRADANFAYLTGIHGEPGAVLMLDPRAPDARRRELLFLRPRNPELEQWDGLRDPIGGELKSRLGIQTIMRTTNLPRMLTASARGRGRLACLHPFAVYDAPVSPDLAAFRRVAERTVGVSIVDRTELLATMRAVKSKAELAHIDRAIEATHAGISAAFQAVRPGTTEKAIQRAIEDAFLDAGASGVAYESIVGSGINGAILHYRDSAAAVRDGELIVLDVGARVGGYCADITRTLPASGRFSREQRRLYEIVLEAQESAIRAVKPGAHLHDFDAAARRVIERAGYGDQFMHGCGHHLGLDVHDASPEAALKPGMVVTVEPGIYFLDQKLGIRIEDDVLVTPAGRRVLSAAIPKTPDEIERAMAGRSRRRR